MTTHRPLVRRSLLRGALGSVLLATATGSFAQAYPNKPVTLIVPWPAGGSTDRHLRGLAEIASKYLGQSIVVENKPGGGGAIAPSQVALSAKPDGYTISQFPMGMLRIPHMQKSAWNPLTHRSRAQGTRQDRLRLHRHRHHAAPQHRGSGDECQGHAEPRALQGQCRFDAGAARRPRHGAKRCHRLGQVCRRRADAAAGDLWRHTHQALAQRAHRQGAGLRRGQHLTLRPGH